MQEKILKTWLSKNASNIITVSRACFSIVLLVTRHFSVQFWILYCLCGISDIMDGLIARKLHSESKTGAILDSIADAFFVASIAMIFVINIKVPMWIWLCAGITLLIRIVAYAVGFIKYHSFVSVHTYGNKITGFLLFMSPLLYYKIGLTTTGIIICVPAILSGAEELLINVLSKKEEHDRKSLL